MSEDQAKPAPQPKKEDPKPAAKPAAAKAGGPPPALDERRLRYEELAATRGAFEGSELLAMLRDGRATVRANAALALAVAGYAGPELVTQLRDSENVAAVAAAEAIAKLGPSARPFVSQIVAACAGTQPDVTDKVVHALAEMVGSADEELGASLDVPLEVAERSVIAACGVAGKKGIATLAKATRHDTTRVRVNAVAGLGKLGKTDFDAAMAALTALEANDPVPDVRTAAKKSMLQVVAREKQEAVDLLPKNIPDFEARKLSASELAEHEAVIDVGQMIHALQDGRDHVKVNGSRALGVKKDKGAPAARNLGLLLRDSARAVRLEAAKALGKIGKGAIDAGADLCGALGDAEEEVVEAAFATLESWGETAAEALAKGLETGSEAGGRKVGELLAKLSNAPGLLAEAFKGPAVNAQVNAALGMAWLGNSRLGAHKELLLNSRTGGDARTRAAVREALDRLDPKGAVGPKALTIDGFEVRFLSAADMEKGKAELANAVPDLVMYLQDGRDIVRSNAALGLGAVGAPAAGAALSLGVLCRDDSPRVRMSAVQAIDKLGDAVVIEDADYLVGVLGDTDAKVADTSATVIKARKARMIGALVRGLETDKFEQARRVADLLNVFDDAVDILCEAIESPAVNTQVNAALALGMIGAKRVGKGRKALESRRTGGDARTREAVRKALEVLDGPKRTGPAPVAVDGFETKLLETAAFGDGSKLNIEDLIEYLRDGRAVVRANSATALGACGANARGAALPLSPLFRDDDPKVRIAAAAAIDKLGDDAVKEIGDSLVGALRGDESVAAAVGPVLGSRKAKVLTALLKGLETDDDVHAKRILELIKALPDAQEILLDAIESPAENVQVNSAIGIGMLGAKRAGTAGRKALESRRTGGFVRTREAAFKGLAMLDA
jgi:HEAT repeat protein